MVGGVLRCLGSSQRLRSRYGHGYQIEIGVIVPDAIAISGQVQTILGTLNKAATGDTDVQLTESEITTFFKTIGCEQWSSRISIEGTGSDLRASLTLNKWVTCKHLASWVILEMAFDQICGYLIQAFGTFVLRERQTSKIRVEVS